MMPPPGILPVTLGALLFGALIKQKPKFRKDALRWYRRNDFVEKLAMRLADETSANCGGRPEWIQPNFERIIRKACLFGEIES